MIVQEFLLAAIAASFLFISGESIAQQYSDNTGVNKRDRSSQDWNANQQGRSTSRQYAENTGVNNRDRSSQDWTADEQGQSKSDLKITQDVRKAVLDQGSVSMYAKNIKLITKDGMVTLKGTVTSVEERIMIENIASKVSGVNGIQNEIKVVSK